MAPESFAPPQAPAQQKESNTSLTQSQRAANQAHARWRVKVEHAISGAKRLGCVTPVYRNKSATFNDRIMALACGIWNWHLTKKKEAI